MKSNRKIISIILIILGLFFTFLPIIINNLRFNIRDRDITSKYEDVFDHVKIKLSELSTPIYIDNNDPSFNWSVAKKLGICSGNGTYSVPYVIEDLVIDGGGSGICILIENSDVYFIIENCTIYNTGFNVSSTSTGIELYNTTNGMINDNNCSLSENGIYLRYSDYNNITGNTVSHNYFGVRLYDSDFTNVKGNTVYDNYWGISANGLFPFTSNNSVSGNIMYNNGFGISIDHSYYTQVSENIANNNTVCGIFITRSDYNIITGNSVNHNKYGIFSLSSDYINIAGNIVNNNFVGIGLDESNNNTISRNIMNNCGLFISGRNEELHSHYIDSSNLVNGKPLYYYSYKVKLNPSNFSNAGQVILVNCNNSLISNLNLSYAGGISLYYCNKNTISGNIINNNTSYGIHLYHSDFNTISDNIINNNTSYGIYLHFSDFNIVSGNVLIGNDECIVEHSCNGNGFSRNGSCTYGVSIVPRYNLFLHIIFLIAILSIAAILINKDLKKF
ncbi:MAG: NosD domain-containing protein [Promethearchaeota archaeon]